HHQLSTASPHLFPPTRRTHPTPTLFPYTTLFRSLERRPRPAGDEPVEERLPLGQGAVGVRVLTELDDTPPQELVVALLVVELARDRKSTRLNSSHLGISYAVFCLKKKKLNSVVVY